MTDISMFSPIIRSQGKYIVSATNSIIEACVAANNIIIITRG